MMNSPAGAVSLAKMAIKQVPPPFDVNTVADLFLQRNMVRLGDRGRGDEGLCSHSSFCLVP